MRNSTSSFLPPDFTSAPPNCCFDAFSPVSVESVNSTLRALPNKSSANDILPTSVLKACLDQLFPFISALFNLSLSSGVFPSAWKASLITPVLKKGKSNLNDPASYRPISNLCVLSKALERIASEQLRSYLDSLALIPSLQSAFRAHHSTETAVLKITSDILRFMDKGNLCLLSLLDLSSAFDSIDHTILLQRLQSSFGISISALSWFHSFLFDRSLSVRHSSDISTPSPLSCGVPQGSVLGPLLFILYTVDIIPLVQNFNLDIHVYADDVQIYGSCHPSNSSHLSEQLSDCLDAVISWCGSNRLLLNSSKTEIMWLCSDKRMHCVPTPGIRVGSSVILPVTSCRILGVTLDQQLSFRAYITRTAATCFSFLRLIRSVRRYLPLPCLKSVVSALVLGRLDYCVSILSGLPASRLKILRSILHASARLIFCQPRYSHVSPLLHDLGWLSIEHRIAFRLAVLVHSSRCGRIPSYLSRELQPVASQPGRSRLRSAMSHSLFVPRSSHPTLGGRAFFSSATRVWNALPTSLASINSLPLFKKLLKSHLSASPNS